MPDDIDHYRTPEREGSMLPAALAVLALILLTASFVLAFVNWGLTQAEVSETKPACVDR